MGARVNFRNIGNHYSIIVGPGPVLPLGDIRHAMFHFLLDPLTLKYQQTISRRAALLLEIASRAPQLPASFQNDFVGLFDVSALVRAVELRVRKSCRPINSNQRSLQTTGPDLFSLCVPSISN